MGRFDKLKGKKILVYGTGRVAESVLDELKGFEVVQNWNPRHSSKVLLKTLAMF